MGVVAMQAKRNGNRKRKWIVSLVVILLLISFKESSVSNGQETYRLPPPEVVDIIDSPPVPGVSLSPDRQWMVFVERSSMPGIEVLARRMLRLAGMRIDPVANARFLLNFDRGLSLRPVAGGEPVRIPLGDEVKISGMSWSHRSDWLLVTTLAEQGQRLWAVSVADPGRPVLLTDQLTTVMGGLDWMPDGQGVLCLLVPEGRGEEPAPSPVPRGPNVQESYGNQSPIRTYQDLLASPEDEALFEYYATGQIALIRLDGQTRLIGKPAIYSGVQVSPDGKSLLVSKIQRPFSYLLTYSGFPRTVEVWDLEGNRIKTVAEIPAAENIPIEGVPTGPRSITWKPGEPRTLYYLEALDEGDPNRPAPFRDRMLRWEYPFVEEATELVRTEHRAMGFSTMADPQQIVVSDFDRDRRWVRSLKYDLRDLSQTPVVMVDRNIRDRYNDPGSFVTVPDEAGFARILQVGEFVYRIGQGATPQGDLPFVDRQHLGTMETERLWRCEPGFYESPVAVLPSDRLDVSGGPLGPGGPGGKTLLITSRESTIDPPNLFLRNLDQATIQPLTHFPDPSPQIRGIRKELVTYQRSDGVTLSATLYLPADYREGQRLPLIVWAYPQEFSDAQTAGQVSGNPDRFVRMSGITHLSLVTQGYAVMDNATMPIIGDPETMNDTFVDQIVSSAAAAIDFAVERGVADRNRVGVGGHSYGAFMTANLLAHCDLFRAGVARSGAYNRTLTPFGFQAERRDFWKAREIYMNLSPFTFANQIKAPILLIHGEEDNNPGTFPVQSQRMYQAIKGNGGDVRLVMLPYESHGYQARESVLHTQAEMIEWFDRYLKFD
jgi:dipeptidyl aminopeptidase/acylaminoacyl peptidase